LPIGRRGESTRHAQITTTGEGGMTARASITVQRSREELQRLWGSPGHRPEGIPQAASVTFRDAPGDRGTEIHVEVEGPAAGKVMEKVLGALPLAKAKDELRRFKQRAETGVISRSDGSPEGERAERKLKQRPAQPLDESELEKAGV
jgi:uncharacterized membrane protein